MTELFLKVVNMSISASWLVLAILIVRHLLKKAPKWVNVLLWGIVAVRLLCPFSIESALSLVPSAETISPEIMMNAEPSIHTGVPMINSVVNPVISQSFSPAPGDSANPLQIWIPVLALIWLAGVSVLLSYTAISYWRLRRNVDTAVLLRDNIYQSENVNSPFVLGLIKPKIYLPFRMDEQELEHVVNHEQAHIGRRDHWWKPLGFLLLTIHWFNPMMWLAYVLLCRDIELACDEKVIQELGNEQRADYSQALLSCSINRRTIAACPLAFGEVGVKERVKSVLSYKKPAFWIVAVSVVACMVVAVCFLTNPRGIKIEDIEQEKGFTIAKQVKTDITLSVPKALLPDAIYTRDGHTFEEDEVVAYQTDTSTIYLDRVMLANEGDEYLYFIFKCSYDLPESGSVLFPYQIKGTRDHLLYSPVVMESSRTLTDDRRAYEDAVRLRGSGPDEQFTFYVDTEACKDAEGTIQIQMICNELTYVKNGSDEHDSGNVDVPLGMRLTLDEVVWFSKKGYNLSWDDFELYPYIETGSGLYIRMYEIDELFHLAIGGAGPNRAPMYIYLGVSGDETNAFIDIRDGGVAEFIEQHRKNVVPKDPLEDAISRAIRDHFTSVDPDGLLDVESHVVLETEEVSGTPLAEELEHIRQTTVYAMALHDKYGFAGATFHEVESWYVPVKLTFQKTEQGEYILSDSWFPELPHESWDEYSEEVYEQFSTRSDDLATSTLYAMMDETYLVQLKQNCYQQAVEAGMVNTDDVIPELLRQVYEHPTTDASNPDEYAISLLPEYNQLVYYGRYTLQHCFAQFLRGGQMDSLGQIMANACKEIAHSWGEAVVMNDSMPPITGQEWFDMFKSNAERLAEQYSEAELEKHYPASWVLLEVMRNYTELVRLYKFTESTEVIKPSVALFDDGTFQFTFSGFSSYLGYGSYEIVGGQLVLNTSDGKYHYVFDMIEKDMIFDAEASSVQTWSSGLYDGAVMKAVIISESQLP